MLQRGSRICCNWSTFWKSCNQQNTWECWTYMACNQQRAMTDSVRPRSWSGDCKTTVSEILTRDLGMKCFMAEFVLWLCQKSKRNIRLQLLMTWFKPLAMNQVSSRRWIMGASLKGTAVSLFHIQCFLYLVSSSINVSIFHSACRDTFWADHFLYIWCIMIILVIFFLLVKGIHNHCRKFREQRTAKINWKCTLLVLAIYINSYFILYFFYNENHMYTFLHWTPQNKCFSYTFI